jgi:phosphatidylglycerol lysyltransferase
MASELPDRPELVWLGVVTVLVGGILLLAQSYLLRFALLRHLERMVPTGALGADRLLRLAVGVLLVYVSFHLSRRRQSAWWVAIVLSGLSQGLQLRSNVPLVDALYSIVSILILVGTREQYYVTSERSDLWRGVRYSVLGVVLAMVYGTAGFMLLDRRDFGRELSLPVSVESAFEQTFLLGNPELVPRTRDAKWFLESLDLVGLLSLGFVVVNLFRPVRDGLAHPLELSQARRIIASWGRSSQDYFRLWPPKSYFFGPDYQSMVCYGVWRGVALGFEDVVGRPELAPATMAGFDAYCRRHGYTPALMNVWEDLLPVYEQLGYRVVKIGETAIVDLASFAEHLPENKDLAYVLRRFQRDGYQLRQYLPPHSPGLLQELRHMSDDWLTTPGRHEAGFSLGYYDTQYLEQCELFCLVSAEGRKVAFANMVPGVGPDRGDVSLDLMRYRTDTQNGVMDALFVMIMLELGARGVTRFNLGLAAMSGVEDLEDKQLEEQLLSGLYGRFGKVFSFKGLRKFKDKFDPVWQPRYLVYRGTPADMVRIGVAYNNLSKMDSGK